MSFSKRLRELRESSGLSQEALAEKLGIPRSTVTHYENSNDRLPRRERLRRIADFFNVTIDYLIGDTDDPDEMGVIEILELKRLSRGSSVRPPDDETDVFFKDYLSAPKEKQEELRRFWDFINQQEKGRKPGDKQGE